ncbi:carboxypeptidase-like regulatory domain-containing protein [Neolewinella persica]|uniref:carboxypeptidase-like regulatory domain-containing protein n=1 Tax=Neolewinella persica TaxID=70998 RepID=UPI00035EF9C1|nr:carboxypeptidase-like regulatory domain-containing protein [Neolewinella persica]
MPRFCILVILLCVTIIGHSQANLSGTLVDEVTGEPVSFATVYLDGTSKGEVTGDDGSFFLRDVALPATLVVSHLNYVNQALSVTSSSGQLSIRLAPREEVLAGVEVTDRNLREKTLAEFKLLLLGTDDWGKTSSIRNDEVLRFDRDYVEKKITVWSENMRTKLLERDNENARWSGDGKEYYFDEAVNLKAATVAPLEIELPHLAYVLRMDLNQFRAQYAEGRRAYLGTFFFADSKEVKRKHLRNRQRAYLGSSMHFARALLANELPQNGFKIVETVKDEVTKQEAVLEIDLRTHLHQVNEKTWELRGLSGRTFTVLYYADGKQRPLPPGKWRRSQPAQSSFYIEADRCVIFAGGVFGDATIAFSGYMGTRGLAWLLPVDYVYEEE